MIQAYTLSQFAISCLKNQSNLVDKILIWLNNIPINSAMESNWTITLFKEVDLSLINKDNFLSNNFTANEFTEDDYQVFLWEL